MINDNLGSKLRKVKGFGSAGNGTSTWYAQRFTALGLIFLSIWFVWLLISILTAIDNASRYELISSPFNTIVLILFIAVGIYHGSLGMKEIVEDYVHKECYKMFSNITIKFVSIISVIACVSAVLAFHFTVFSEHIKHIIDK